MMAIDNRLNVPLLDLSHQYDRIRAEISGAVQRVLDSRQFIMGPEVGEFEREIAAYCHSAHAIGCASGSDALLLALMGLGIGPGDDVITSPFTFFATGGAISRLGARPVFVDIEPATFNIDPDLIEDAITTRTRAIMPVHLFGQCAEMERIDAIAANRGLAIIEDAAQAIGAQYCGTRAGNLGSVATFSFYPSKNLGGAGDGGLLTTNDETLAARLRTLRVHGGSTKYHHDSVGINSRLDSIQAAILRVKLRYLEEWTEGRRLNASRYRKLFAAAGLLERGKVVLPAEHESRRHVFNQFVIRAEHRDDLRNHLREHGVGTEVYYPLPLHLQPCFAGLGYREGDFPESERAAREALAIPVYPELGADAQQQVVERIESFYGKR